MKNRGIMLLVMLTGMFACGLIGFFIGRSVNHSEITMSGYVEPTRPTVGHPTEPSFDQTSPSEPLLVNINTATVDELMTLPGIGATLAQRIVDYRSENGAFESLSDLLNVDDIGQTRLENILDYITIGGKP